jgi:hypothetical protein
MRLLAERGIFALSILIVEQEGYSVPVLRGFPLNDREAKLSSRGFQLKVKYVK